MNSQDGSLDRKQRPRQRYSFLIQKPWNGHLTLIAIGTPILMGLIACFIAFILPFIQNVRDAARFAYCNNKLKQISIALQNYHDNYGEFPPAYSVDKSGKPLHSWRTILLPYLCGNKVYDQLRLDEPWNSPHNLAIFKKNDLSDPEDSFHPRLPFYQCPSSPPERNASYTSYAMVVGPGCAFDGPNKCQRDNLVNGTNNTIIIVETTAPIRWYEPKDIDVETLNKQTPGEEPPIDSFHLNRFHAVFADGSVAIINKNYDKDALQVLIKGRVKKPNTKQAFEKLGLW